MNTYLFTYQDGTTETMRTKREAVWALAIEQAKGRHLYASTHATRELAEKARLSKATQMLLAGTPHTPFVHASKRGDALVMAEAAADDAKYQASPERWVRAYVVEGKRI